MHLAKSMLGGSLEDKNLDHKDIFPAPDAYEQNRIHSIPGFVIMQDSSKTKKEDDKNAPPVGP